MLLCFQATLPLSPTHVLAAAGLPAGLQEVRRIRLELEEDAQEEALRGLKDFVQGRGGPAVSVVAAAPSVDGAHLWPVQCIGAGGGLVKDAFAYWGKMRTEVVSWSLASVFLFLLGCSVSGWSGTWIRVQ